MKKFRFLLCAVFVLLLMFGTSANAVPVLPGSSSIIFEFDDWEYITGDSTTIGRLDNIGEGLNGVFFADAMKIAGNATPIWSPTANVDEITGIFYGATVANIINIVDLDNDFIPEQFNIVWNTNNAYLEAFYDNTADFNYKLGVGDGIGGSPDAFDTAGDGTPLLKLKFEYMYATVTNPLDSAFEKDWSIHAFGYANIDTTAVGYIWNNLFVQGLYNFGSNNYDFFYQVDIFADGTLQYNQNALVDSGKIPWDYYTTDDLRGSTVPEPATMLLLGTGLIGLAAAGRRKFFKKG